MIMGALATLLAAASFVGLDRYLTKTGLQKPYYAVHVLHNTAIVALTVGDVWTVFTDIDSVFRRDLAWSAVYLCYGLHVYHLYEYWRTFHLDDWLHHVLMIGLALPLGCASRSGALMGASLFFTTGLPGGINYALLCAERNGWISKEIEKSINVPVHQWIRGPGCVVTGALTLTLTLSASGALWWERTAASFVSVLLYWNGIYFANQVVRADERRRALSRPEGAGAGASNTARTPANPTVNVAPQ